MAIYLNLRKAPEDVWVTGWVFLKAVCESSADRSLTSIRSHTISSPSVQENLETGRPNACNQCHLDKTLAWTGIQLKDWYGIEQPALTAEQQTVAASVLWLLKGDAAQRAIMAWSYGWKEARDASGTDWLPPYLSQLMVDPYATVRYIAWRSLRQDTVFEEVRYDHLAPLEDRKAKLRQSFEVWRQSPGSGPAKPEVLMRGPGQLDGETFRDLLIQRNDKPLFLNE